MTTTTDGAAAAATPAAAPVARRVAAQAGFEARMILRNGEQVLVAVVIPVLALVGLVRASFIDIETGGAARVDLLAPGVLALAVMTASFTSQAIATAFDRRNGVLRLLATTPLGRGGLLAGKVLGVLAVEAVQVVLIAGAALALGWRPDPGGALPALVGLVLGTAAFTALALLVAGTLRAEAVLALANLLLLVLALGGGVILPAERLPGPFASLAAWLPSGALGDVMRGALVDGALPLLPALVLVGWTTVLGVLAARLFRWH
ncbi:ABC transporter permease [Cellulomonas wangsupingiae]|uniref:ABC transporter permease n=1 Tax=Cellulomonas wangsupingiae TaxID=2968085 RepID=A0ABY5K8D7_9CELL|nr:ABC transporter permease [Cellulomonas wangsupingiae]MCC2333006.1 ABC transporter permease [Cellulomonas wangsupingiae]MCM0640364.1 ABC transporter permease [Cellulomonas wangsupingiae]UUI66722.1 ABC transporter permease [Cellulomonas wangsupingiae]